MKKHLFTCFLAWLCLIGSPPILSQVADSPTGNGLVDADSLHPGREESRSPALPDSLSIGDKIPDGIILNELLNSVDSPIQLDKLKGKFVILQFWAPSCTGSMGSLPKIDKLVDSYKDQIELIPITTFPKESVERVFDSYSSLEEVDSPVVVNAGELRSLFPHTTIPHFVILDPESRVLAITGQEDITRDNLELMLAGKEAQFRHKVDRKIRIDRNTKLISESSELPNKNIWFQSALTGYIPDVGGSLIQNFEGLSHIRIVNMPLFQFYRLAYSERDLVDYFGRNRIITIGFDEEELFTDKSGADYVAWKEEGNHVFGYELIAPPSKNPYALMREDLNRYFPNIKARVEKRKQRVYALVQQEGKSYPKAMASKRQYSAGQMGVSMRNYPLQGFVYHLNTYFYQGSPYPVYNLTEIDYPIDLDLNVPLSNPEKLRKALQELGLDLVEREEEINVLVLEKTGETKPLVL